MRLIPFFYIDLHLICFSLLWVAVQCWINKVELESICFDWILISQPGSKVIDFYKKVSPLRKRRRYRHLVVNYIHASTALAEVVHS